VDTATEILVEILAATDAIWMPLRDWSGSRPTNVYYARSQFARHGVTWRAGNRTETELKARSRTLQDLKDTGKVLAWQPKLKSLRVKLTANTEAEARRWCKLPPLAAAVATTREIAKHSDRKPTLLNRFYVAETVLNDGKGWGDATKEERRGLVLTEEMLAPALHRRWVVSLSDIQGHVYFALTSTGWDALEHDYAESKRGRDQKECADLYYRQLAYVLTTWGAPVTDANRGELGAIPLPVSMFGVEVGCYGLEIAHATD